MRSCRSGLVPPVRPFIRCCLTRSHPLPLDDLALLVAELLFHSSSMAASSLRLSPPPLSSRVDSSNPPLPASGLTLPPILGTRTQRYSSSRFTPPAPRRRLLALTAPARRWAVAPAASANEGSMPNVEQRTRIPARCCVQGRETPGAVQRASMPVETVSCRAFPDLITSGRRAGTPFLAIANVPPSLDSSAPAHPFW